ncbi:MAG: hypothetical protein GWN71_01825 [Gammaproteobacteria bacterium]|nr:diacylglycerol kinase family lipid kinase [Gemmatimonadota bacterium]NIR34779.1 diacylglycerol kinase family lipid kinase [Actinomycetota bacterium]NIU72351.1 hypothetical protein [Gammaproteobacteria bacterium]NIX18608.1 hypothetical protein [Actinomycetota bacterium]
MPSYLLIVNPVAGGGEGRDRARALADALPAGSDVEIAETAGRGEAADIAAERADDVDRVVAVGGDGTLNEVLAGLMRARGQGRRVADLGMLPSGTANGARRAFGLGLDPVEVAEALPGAEPRPVDVAIASHAGGERPFLLRAGAGLDAAVFRELDSSRAGILGFLGLLRHAPGVLSAMRTFQPPHIGIEVDGTSFGTAGSVVLSNVGRVGLGATVAEDADPADGELDVLAVRLPSKLSIARLGLRMLVSSLASDPEVRHTRASYIRLASDREVPFQLDGEPVGSLPLEVRVETRAVRLLLT